jgi:hypothetical protein
MKKLIVALAMAGACLDASVVLAKKPVVMSSLELQQLQGRDIEASKDQVFGAVMSVLQDSGYRIQAADKDTGLITGIASTKGKMSYSLWTGFGKSKKTPIVSAFIEQTSPSTTHVRLSFVMGKVKSTVYGSGAQDEEPIYDVSVYQTAFEQINQTVFIRQTMKSPAATVASRRSAHPATPVATTVAPAAPSAPK